MMIRCIFFFCVIVLSLTSIECSHSEKTLVRKLLRDYEPLARPVNDSRMPVLLTIIVTLKQIVDLDERNQILKTNIWLEYYWNDTNLTWDPVRIYFLSNRKHLTYLSKNDYHKAQSYQFCICLFLFHRKRIMALKTLEFLLPSKYILYQILNIF